LSCNPARCLDLGDTRNSGTMRAPSGRCMTECHLRVKNCLFSIPADHSQNRAGSRNLCEPRCDCAQSHGSIPPQQPQKFKGEGLQPAQITKIQQIKYFPSDAATDVPGPGIYQPHNDLSNEGKYVLSKNISAGQRKFLDGRRLSFTEITARRSFSKHYSI
jgi:hypothetical protein